VTEQVLRRFFPSDVGTGDLLSIGKDYFLVLEVCENLASNLTSFLIVPLSSEGLPEPREIELISSLEFPIHYRLFKSGSASEEPPEVD